MYMYSSAKSIELVEHYNYKEPRAQAVATIFIRKNVLHNYSSAISLVNQTVAKILLFFPSSPPPFARACAFTKYGLVHETTRLSISVVQEFVHI